jgi:MFS family permease
VYVPIAGWLADKYHPVRVYLWANILWFAVQPVNLIWLFWHASPAQYFYVMILQGFFLTWPVAMLLQGVNIPMIMRLYPRERYGQFCSCAATFSSLTGIVAGGLGGALISVLKHYFSERTSYCLIPVWSMFFTGISTWLMILLYRSWKQYGGDESYVPPLPAHLVEAAPAVLPADEYV